MKIQCDACERAEAAVLCCADEAALCWECDEKVHAANKLAGKHQRVPLLKPPSSQIPNCDICQGVQEKAGYFFCLEDRALLCRQCDVSIHTASPYVSSHQRFLVTGVKVALQHSDSSNSSNTSKTPVSNDSSAEPDGKNRRGPIVTGGNARAGPVSGPTLSSQHALAGVFMPHWPLDEILAGTEFEHCYGFSELASSKG